MALSRGSHKVERVRVTFVPTTDEASFRNVPSTFSPSSRTYGWKSTSQIDYLIIPKKISSNEIVVDVFIERKKGKLNSSDLQKTVQSLVDSKIHSEWQGLKLSGIGRATSAIPPDKRFVRGTIEEILGTRLDQ